MKKNPLIIFLILICLTGPFSTAAQEAKKVIATTADLPKFDYAAPENLDGFVTSDAVYQSFAAMVRADLETLLRDYDVRDKLLQRRFEMVLSYLDVQDGKLVTAKERIKRIRALETPANILDQAWRV